MFRKKLFCFIVLAITFSGWSQEFKEVMRYEYKMTFKPTIGSDVVENENVYLDVWDNRSRFASEQRVKFIEFLADDKNIMWRLETIEAPGIESGQNFMVLKEKKDVYYCTKAGSTFVQTVEPLNAIAWDITTEISDYEGMKVQKATADFKGRSWEVWFTKDISLIEGPYKFKNLPGFVVKAATTDGDYLFEFTKSEKAQTVLKYHSYEIAAVITESELKKAREVVANKSQKQLFAEQGVTVITDDNPTLEQAMNKKIGDRINYIEIL